MASRRNPYSHGFFDYFDDYYGPPYNEEEGYQYEEEPVAPMPQPPEEIFGPPETEPEPTYDRWGEFTPEGLDLEKIQKGHATPKYLMGKVLSNFDPKQGFTPEVLKALNALGIGEFSANRDILSVGGEYDPRFEDTLFSDMIRDFGGENASWQGWGGIVPGREDEEEDGFNISSMFGKGGGGGGGGGGGSYQGGGSYSSRPAYDIKGILEGLFPGGAFNQDIVNRRTEVAKSALERERRSRNATNNALLAERGLIGSGPEKSAIESANFDLGSRYADALSGIYATESENADARMMQAISLATGMTLEEAKNALLATQIGNDFTLGMGRLNLDKDLGFGKLDLDRTLGLGNLGLGNLQAMNSYNLGLGQLGLNRDIFNYGQGQDNIENYLKLLELYFGGGGISRGGYR